MQLDREWVFVLELEVIIDEDSSGKVGRKELKNYYKIVNAVGEDLELPKGMSDSKLISKLRERKADLLTCDKEAYTHFYDYGVKTVEITEFTNEARAIQICYIIKIIKTEN